jgi:hypothetical protein
MTVKADSVLGSILLGAVAGAITGGIVYLVPIKVMSLEWQTTLALKDGIIFLAIGAFVGFVFGAVGGLPGRYVGSAVSKKRGAAIGAIVGGVLGGLTVFGCSVVSIIGMGM